MTTQRTCWHLAPYSIRHSKAILYAGLTESNTHSEWPVKRLSVFKDLESTSYYARLHRDRVSNIGLILTFLADVPEVSRVSSSLPSKGPA